MYKLNEKLSWRILEGEAVALDVDTGQYFTMNPTATVIWEQLSKSAPVEAIAAAITERFDVDEKTARADVQEQLDEWLRNGLIAKAE